MNFSNAQMYCLSSIDAVNMMRAKHPALQEELNRNIELAKRDYAIQSQSFDEIVQTTVSQVKDIIEENKEEPNDEQTVAWHLGMLCYLYRNACPVLDGKYDELFIKSWNKYFM